MYMKEIRKEMRFCGSCRYFKNEDINGDGWCIIKDSACRCDHFACFYKELIKK